MCCWLFSDTLPYRIFFLKTANYILYFLLLKKCGTPKRSYTKWVSKLFRNPRLQNKGPQLFLLYHYYLVYKVLRARPLLLFIYLFLLFHFFKFYFILLYNTVLVLPYINMNLPRLYTCSQSWTPLPPLSPYHQTSTFKISIYVYEPILILLTHDWLFFNI